MFMTEAQLTTASKRLNKFRDAWSTNARSARQSECDKGINKEYMTSVIDDYVYDRSAVDNCK